MEKEWIQDGCQNGTQNVKEVIDDESNRQIIARHPQGTQGFATRFEEVVRANLQHLAHLDRLRPSQRDKRV